LDVAVERATAPLAEQQAKEERSAANVQEQKPEREQTRERGDDRGRDWGMGR
jgi:Ni/Co efflux regulator RcnB